MSLNRPAFLTLVNKPDLIGVEIGVLTAKNAQNLLQNLDIRKLYLVDNYRDNYVRGFTGVEVKCVAEMNLSKYAGRFEFVVGDSLEVANNIPDNLDFVYVDGGHDYKTVKQDLNGYFPKVKNGGMFGGHNFEVDDVRKAVMEFCREKRLSFPGFFKCMDADDHSDNYDWFLLKVCHYDVSNDKTRF